jgi:hypothetical protein
VGPSQPELDAERHFDHRRRVEVGSGRAGLAGCHDPLSSGREEASSPDTSPLLERLEDAVAEPGRAGK